MRPPPRWKVMPERNTSPPWYQLMKTVSIGSGTAKGSPYISVSGTTKPSPRPCAIGWLRLIAQTRSCSPASRHFRLQGVPMRRLKIFE